MKYEGEADDSVIVKKYYDIDINEWVDISKEWIKNHIFRSILTKKSVNIIRPQREIRRRGGTRKKLKRRFMN
jgi:hypothetical protein